MAKIPPNYFVLPSIWLFWIAPIVWGLLPIAAFVPEKLAPYCNFEVYKSILASQVNCQKMPKVQNKSTFLFFQHISLTLFKIIVILHSLEILYVIYKCNRLNLSLLTTVKWIVSVGIFGIISLRFLQNVNVLRYGEEEVYMPRRQPPFGYASPTKRQ